MREGRGKGAARATRREGLVPAIIYGHKLEPMAVQLPEQGLSRFLGTSGENTLINMELGADKTETVMIKEVQIDPVSRRVVHVDFVRVSLEERVTTHIPITLVGEAPGVEEGGILEFPLRELQIECQVGQMPEKIEIDISELGIGSRIRVSSLELGEELTVLDASATIIVSIVAPSIMEEVEEEEIEGLEDEELEPEVIGEKREEEDEEEEE